MTVTTPIRGKIAAILTDRTVVINRGEEHGVTKKMRFEIQHPLDVIKDPDDPSKTLGSLYYKKGTVRVGTVYETMSICIMEPKSVRATLAVESLLGQQEYPHVDTPIVTSDQLIIKVGDRIRQVTEETDDSAATAKTKAQS